MTKKIFSKKILVTEMTGFLILILILCLDEILDLPNLIFGAEATPINYTEIIIESAIVGCLGVIVIFFTLKLFKKIKYLEGFLQVCSCCKKIRVGNNWIDIKDFIKEYSEVKLTESLCPECISKNYGVF